VNAHVTGGSGFLGGFVIPRLRAHGHDVSALVRSGAAAARVERLGATPIPGNLDDPASVDSAFELSGADVLVNLASLGFGHAPSIVAAAEESGLRRAVFVSTTSIFTTLDTATKPVRVAAEEAIRSSRLDWTIVRPTMIYGAGGDRNMARLLRLLRTVPFVPVPGGGDRLQQPVHVEDVAAAVVAAAETPSAIRKAYDIAGPEPLTLRQVLGQAADAVGRPVRVVPLPLAPTVAAARVYERVAHRPRLRAEQLERLSEDKAFDITPARRDLGFDPRPFVDGIRQEAMATGYT
jgi:nucleoside-diphosphate-sugar epimerase